MVAEEVKLLKTLVSDLEKELKTKGLCISHHWIRREYINAQLYIIYN